MSAPEKTLSLIVPVYNTASYLRRCLGSVINRETPPDLELIAVNDGSTDASPAILREYEARFPALVRVIDRKNGGHGAAINTGLAAAAGRFFRVLDSDDWLDTPGFINYVNQLRRCGEDLVVTPYTQEHANGTELRYDYAFLEPERVYRFEELSWREGMEYFCLASATWRTQLLRSCKLRLPEHCSYVDMLYALKPIARLTTLRLLPIPLYRYWIGREGQSMDPAVLRRQTPMHQRVLTELVRWYGMEEAALSESKRAYLHLVLGYMLHTHAQLLCVDGSGSRDAYRAALALDRELERVPTLREAADRHAALRWSRRLRYLNVRLLPPGAVRLLMKLPGAWRRL